MTHRELVELSARWLRGTQRCTVVLTEAQGGHEVPDAIGWAGSGRRSIMVECKVTRADFLRDARKLSRTHADLFRVGQRRIYITTPGIIFPGECPEGWAHGVAVRVGGRSVVRMHVPLAPQRTIDPEIMAREVPYLVAALAVAQAEPGAFCGLSGGRVLARVRMPDRTTRASCAACIRAKRPCPAGLVLEVTIRTPSAGGDPIPAGAFTRSP